jgi:hypothetical protein
MTGTGGDDSSTGTGGNSNSGGHGSLYDCSVTSGGSSGSVPATAWCTAAFALVAACRRRRRG